MYVISEFWRYKIEREMDKAVAKFPWWPSEYPIHAAAIVCEEAGELIRAALRFQDEKLGDWESMDKEAIQTIAVCLRFLDRK